ncbi:MBL fold metallo-hydrolase [Mycolicibacterium obuense]|uniref:MBL fold metallo-hydrolase n=1 Tax=Mycolicibacterium obuense TaxID=1807 RepID=A0A4R5XAU0_9MYCO|nr:MBL fold metallo-hydrolase [Mycolicibacterium obuense]
MSQRIAPESGELAVEHIADHVIRVPLPLPLPDLKVVNAYVIIGNDGVTLLDPGWAVEESERTLRAALDSVGVQRTDVRRILATHQHWDHYSLGVSWRDRYGIELLLGREEQHSIAAFDPAEGVHPRQLPMLRAAGAAALADRVARLEWEPYERDVAFSFPDRWLDDGDEIDCGGVRIVARATPGHTRGHVVFDDVEHGLVFSGDHLLPRITPSIAFERAPDAMPLRSYLSSLQLFVDLPDARMLPAHGSADGATRARAIELLDHHRDRLRRIADSVAAGAQTAFEVADRMTWTRRERSLAELGVVHAMTAVLEVQSHMRLLAARQVLTAQDEDGVELFAVL